MDVDHAPCGLHSALRLPRYLLVSKAPAAALAMDSVVAACAGDCTPLFFLICVSASCRSLSALTNPGTHRIAISASVGNRRGRDSQDEDKPGKIQQSQRDMIAMDAQPLDA